SLLLPSGPHHAAEAGVRLAGADLARLPAAGAVAGTVHVGTQVRPAAQHAHQLAPAVRVVAGSRTRGIAHLLTPHDAAAGLRPLGAPLPGVAGHVVQPVSVGRVRFHRRQAGVAVLAAVAAGKLALPGVGHPLAAGAQFVAPVVALAVQPAAGGPLPLGLGGQLFAGPVGVGGGVLVADVDDRVIVLALDGGARPLGVPPRGALDDLPPLVAVAALLPLRTRLRRREHQRE